MLYVRPSISAAESKHSSIQNYNNSQNTYNNISNVQGFVRPPAQLNSFDSGRNESKASNVSTGTSYEYNSIKPKLVVPVKPVVLVIDNTKLENNVTVKLQKALQARYRRLSDELDEEFANQTYLDQAKIDINDQIDQLDLLKANFEVSLEDLEKKNKELGTEMLILKFCYLYYYYYYYYYHHI